MNKNIGDVGDFHENTWSPKTNRQANRKGNLSLERTDRFIKKCQD